MSGTQSISLRPRVVALSGGVGGARMVTGLCSVMDARELLVVANTGDDFEHLGLYVTPDLDTIIYTTTGRANRLQGWGREGETWTFMSVLRELGAEDWFLLGDGDLALHVERSWRLRAGEGLGAVIERFARRLGVPCGLVPASDQAVRTIVETANGPLSFQEYFVRERCRPVATGIRFEGADAARPHPCILPALADTALEAVVITPSNPLLSIDPILAVPGMREALAATHAPVIAVSPIVAGEAIKGPAAKLFREIGSGASALAVAEHYGELLDGFVVDEVDAAEAGALRARGLAVTVTDTIMRDDERKAALARDVLALAAHCRARTPGTARAQG